MSFGSENYTTDGSLLTSSLGKNLHYVGTATLTTTTTTQASYAIVSVNEPMVFARIPVNSTVCISMPTGTSPNWTFNATGTGRLSSTFICFAALSTESALSTYGMRILTDTGEVSFDSSRFPLWISEIFTVNSASIAKTATQVAYANTYVTPAVTAPASAQATPGPGGGIYILGVKAVTGGHVLEWCTVQSGTGSPPTTLTNIDTTNVVIESSYIV